MHKKLQKTLKIFLCIVLLLIAAYYMVYSYFVIGMTKMREIDNVEIYIATKDTAYKNDIMLALDSCLVLLKQNNIHTKTNERIIFCTNINTYNQKTFFLHKNTLGVNHSLFKTIIIAPADYKNNKQNKYDERLINRKLSDAVVHEITHLYIQERVGYLQNIKMGLFQKWKIEGFCEYVANSSSFDIEKGKHIFFGDEILKKRMLDSDLMKSCYFYFESRLKTDFLLSHKKLTFNEFVNTNFNDSELKNEIRKKLVSGEYVFDKQ